MRYLVEPFAVGALRRGKSIEQFLGGVGSPDEPVIRWAEIRPVAEGCAIVLHDVVDVGGEHFIDLGAFPELEDDDGEENFGLQVGVASDEAAALGLAEELLGADRGRWVNQFMAGDDYLDYVRAGRAGWPLAGSEGL